MSKPVSTFFSVICIQVNHVAFFSIIDLQSLVADVFVCLASHGIRADELWDFLTLFKSEEPPVVWKI